MNHGLLNSPSFDTVAKSSSMYWHLINPSRALLIAAMGFLLLPSWSVCFAASRVVGLHAQPERLELTGDDPWHGVIVTTATADHRGTDVTDYCRFRSSKPALFTTDTNGLCRAVADGEGELLASWRGEEIRIPVVVRRMAGRPAPSFRQDIVPLLTRSGCNSGGCHGKLSGQNGFKLSLRGYAPERDYESLTSDVRGRRVDFAFPDQSLMVMKAVGTAPHEGRQRFAAGSRYCQTLIDWLAARAPAPVAAEEDAASVEILPGDRVLAVGDTQRLLAVARYPNGRVRDVTWLAQFFSNDPVTFSVTPEGRVKSLRPGETSIRVHFQGCVSVVRMTTPYPHRVDHSMFVQHQNGIDGPVFRKLEALRLPPSEGCDDLTFLRRAFLDTLGALPTPEEARVFETDSRGDKRARLIDELLARPEFADYWTLQLSDLFQNRKERDHDVRGTKGVRSFQTWLRTAVAENRPWDRIASEVLLARGSTLDHPEIGYFITTVGEKERVEESEVADSVAQAFLGTRIGCARCHNHPLERFTQDDFYHFSAYFSRVNLRRQEPDQGPTELKVASREEWEKDRHLRGLERELREARDAMGLAKDDKARAEAEKRASEKMKQIVETQAEKEKARRRPSSVEQPRTHQSLPPRALDRKTLNIPEGVDPRESLVAWLTRPDNEAFSGAMVNRLWKHFFNVGLVEQVDDLRASNPPTNPELWDFLRGEFVGHGYDLRHVMRLILNSRAYQLSSGTRSENQTETKFYSHYYARRLPAEVLLDAVSQATGVPDAFDGYPVGMRAVQLPEPGVGSYFLSLFGRSDRVTACACERKGEVTLPQLLHLHNGEEMNRKIRNPDGRLSSLLRKPGADVIDQLFLAAFGRPPSASERTRLESEFADAGGREAAYRDLFWALLNSKEFAFNH